jgi:hypothetical protein
MLPLRQQNTYVLWLRTSVMLLGWQGMDHTQQTTKDPWQRGTTLVRRHIARLPGSGQSTVGGTGVGWMITGHPV